ncbi:MAG: GTP-binding protein [Candidatus Liptonbacteria bacterium]
MEKNIRNFVIIAHVDHGKSTLADRMLEITGTVEARKMRPQYLDQLELERERGITIKMAPVRMHYRALTDSPQLTTNHESKEGSGGSSVVGGKSSNSEYILNLIDTPGHSDFQYEVSRALAAVEGAILLVDVTKGIQAQTLSNLRQARKNNLRIIGAVNKIDLQPERAPKVCAELAELLGVPKEEIHMISGKTGIGAEGLLRDVVAKVPPPHRSDPDIAGRALIFDSFYNDHKGILAYVRVVDGEFKAGMEVELIATGAKCKIKEVGCFAPELKTVSSLRAGEIGYVASGLKEPSLIKIGDTILADGKECIANSADSAMDYKPLAKNQLALLGYREPAPVVFISFYPDGATEFDDLKRGFERLRLTDSALSFEPDANEALGRGLKAGFLGQLHFEIAASRLEREFNLHFLTSFPSIAYKVRVSSRGGSASGGKDKGEWRIVKDAHQFPSDPEEVMQPIIKVEIITPAPYLNAVVSLQQAFQLEVTEIHTIGESVLINGKMPLAELIRDFDDQLKSTSAGYASFSYELEGDSRADVEKLEILIVGEVASALTRIVFRKDLEREGRATVERLKELLPRQQFVQALQARAQGRVIARETIAALKKKLGDFGKNSGDRTRKMKLWKKQQKGKERLQESARVNLSVEIFREILKK